MDFLRDENNRQYNTNCKKLKSREMKDERGYAESRETSKQTDIGDYRVASTTDNRE